VPRVSSSVSSHGPGGAATFYRSRHPARRYVIPVVLLIVLLLLGSGLPVPLASAGATAPATGGDPDAPTPPAVTPPSIGSAGAGPAPTISQEERCLLGEFSKCGDWLSSQTPAVTPSAAPSAWTNITPTAPAVSPPARWQPAEVYYPNAHEDILFGGYNFNDAPAYLQDTWAFSDSKWTELLDAAECTPTTCPSARAGAVLAYDEEAGALVLFGGQGGRSTAYMLNDTWLLTCTAPLTCSWSNITGSLGPAPSPRAFAAMTYAPSDQYDVLFGGMTLAQNTLGDTWEFNGAWKNLTADEGGATGYETLKAPEPRSEAAIASSPNGYVLLFGGVDSQDNGGTFALVENYCDDGAYHSLGNSTVAWWFYDGTWRPMDGWGDTETGPCAPPPPPRPGQAPHAAATPAASSLVPAPPCGREGAALGWSPKNNQWVLYGGFGSNDKASGNNCTANLQILNDTWLYDNASGGGFLWRNAGDSGDPPNRMEMGYATDLTDDYFEIYGGVGSVAFSSTYRFFEAVHAKLTGPDSYDTNVKLHLVKVPFVVVGFGGSGTLDYLLTAQGLKGSNTLDPVCQEFYNASSPLPSNGTVVFDCAPTTKNYNVYRLTLQVTDALNTSDTATATWIYTVLPQEEMWVASEYAGYFFENVTLTNTFTIYAEVSNAAASSLVVTMGGRGYTAHQNTSSPDYWTVNVNMANVPVAAILHADGTWGDWTQNATYNVTEIELPTWLGNVWEPTGGNQTIKTFGSGPYNRSYIVNETYDWELGSGGSFSTPAVDALLSSAMSLFPNENVVFTLDSSGLLGVTATFPFSIPSINFGDGSVNLGVVFSLTGTFNVTGDTVTWVNATASLEVYAQLNLSIPIYGFCILGVCIGITLQISVNATAALQMILAPSDSSSNDIMGLGIMIANVLGGFSIMISAAAQFSIVIASVGVGLGVGIAFRFATEPDFQITHWWLNGTVFATASFLWWSTQWNIASGPLAQGDPPAGEGHPAAAPAYNNGSSEPWLLDSRYYNGSGYDHVVWLPTATDGAAISDIYPYTQVAGTAAANGADLFFTNDNVSRPVQDGLGVSADLLNGTSNELTALPAPTDPGFVDFAPRATTIPNGTEYVLWDAVPSAETSAASPTDLTSIALQGAWFHPSTGTWGPVRTFSEGGFAGGFQVDDSGGAARVVELQTDTPLFTNTTTERLITYDLATGAIDGNVSVSGVTALDGFRAGAGLAVVQTATGGYGVVATATGLPVAIDYVPPTDYNLTSASFVQGAPTDLALLYRGPNATELVVYNASSGSTVAATSVGINASEVEGLASAGNDYLFVRAAGGIEAWKESDGSFSSPSFVARPNLDAYGVVQDGEAIVVYSLNSSSSGPNATVTLSFAEFGATLAPPPGSKASGSRSAAPNPIDYLVYVAIAAAAVVAVLAVVAVISRRRPPTRPTAPSPSPPVPPGAG